MWYNPSPFRYYLPEAIFKQDNARPHIANITLDFLTEIINVNLLPWPPRSPDLNPFEHVWDMTDRVVYVILPVY